MNGNIVNNFGSFPVVFKKGQGSTLTDVNDKEYIDFVSGIGVNCLGHNNKELTNAIIEQCTKQIHISNYYNSDIGLEYSQMMLKATNMEKVFFGNSGAEANEAAIKLARKYGYLQNPKRKVIVTLEKSFHGRTITTLKATGQDKFHNDYFAPYPEGFKYIKANDYEQIKTAFDDTTCAFMIECVQGEGGVNLIDEKWAQEACKLARQAGAIVIADEVQTGMGRTGTLFASEQLKINPEIITTAKGIAGGIPMGACFYRGKAASVFETGDHQSTFGGNPLACAGAKAVLTTLLSKGFLERVIVAGEKIRNGIKDWNLPCVKNVRGKGLMIGVDIEQSSSDIQRKCLQNGLCISTAGANTLRFLPPLVITDAEIEKGLEILKKILTA